MFAVLPKLEQPAISWEWTDKANGVITWKFVNPNKKNISFVLARGLKPAGSDVTPENVYLFGDAFGSLYYYSFGTPFVTTVAPVAEGTEAPLGIVESNGHRQIAFIFTLGANETYTMQEAGWVNYEPAGISGIIAHLSKTEKYQITYSHSLCEDYNKQTGADYTCPPDPYTVESCLFTIDSNITPEGKYIIKDLSKPDTFKEDENALLEWLKKLLEDLEDL